MLRVPSRPDPDLLPSSQEGRERCTHWKVPDTVRASKYLKRISWAHDCRKARQNSNPSPLAAPVTAHTYSSEIVPLAARQRGNSRPRTLFASENEGRMGEDLIESVMSLEKPPLAAISLTVIYSKEASVLGPDAVSCLHPPDSDRCGVVLTCGISSNS
jgi:hypothetical protein